MLTAFVAAMAFSTPLYPPTVCCVAAASEPYTWVKEARAIWPQLLQTSRERAFIRMSGITMTHSLPAQSYLVLGVRAGASPKELKAAYRARAKQCHPDVNPSSAAAEQFQLLTEVSARPTLLYIQRKPQPRPSLVRDIGVSLGLGTQM